ncbi:ATP-binding cassette domain-containing protein, partial [Klebsiella oxytoca]
LRICKNQKVGIYGKSGSGKTTFMKIISGQIRSYTGEIQLNKVELNRIKYSALQKILLYVEQTPYLFNDTVRYNLTLGEHFTDNEIIDALKKANLWKTISN